MSLCKHIVLLASYNEWMNTKLYEAAGKLSPQELAADRKAYFGSLLGTLNHLVVADIVWLKRFLVHPTNFAALDPVREMATPTALDQVLLPDFAQLSASRRQLDGIINEWAAALTEADLQQVLRYSTMKGAIGNKPLSSLLFHFFNHQTHHRGQATTLLSQAGQDVGVTDLLVLMPNQAEA